MKTLLAIINEPKESRDFIQYVAGMAADLKTNIHLLFVQNPINYAVGTTGATGPAINKVRQSLENMADTAKELLTEHIKDVKSKLSEDVVIDFSTQLGVTSILAQELVSDNKADMVVLEGQKKESTWIQTSSNMEIIKSADCPVFIVPNALVYKPFSKIIYATDYKEEDIVGLKKLITLTQHYSPVINVLHITNSVDFEEKVKKAGFLKILQKRTSYDHLLVKVLHENDSNDTAELLNDYASLIKADLIVVLKENKSFFERIFNSDPAGKIIKKSLFPVLVFHEK